MTYRTGGHTKFYHRFHVVWVTKYRFKVLPRIIQAGAEVVGGRGSSC